MKPLRSRAWTRGGLAGLLTLGILAFLPVAPAAAAQTISWNLTPPASAVVGETMSFSFTGTANTLFAPRITGCFVSFPDGNNYTNSFGGNFTSGNCPYANRPLPTLGTYPITVGFTMSSPAMTLNWNVDVVAPIPTVTVPTSAGAVATSVNGAPVTYSASAADSYYGTYGATCSPESGSVFPLGTTTVNCSATNPGDKTGTASFPVTVDKGTPTLDWSPPTSVTYGTTYGDLETAAMQAADATGSITYTRVDGATFAASDPVPVGADQVLRATYEPSGPATAAYNPVTVERTVSVVKAATAVTFAGGTPTTKQYGDATFPVSVTGTPGGGDVTVSAQSGSACTVSSPATGTSATATVTLTGAGSCVLLADQPATDTHAPASTAQWSVTVAKANPQLTWTPPSSLTYGDPVSDLLGAVADVPGTFAYLVDGTAVAPETVLDVGADRVVSVVFTPDQGDDYVEASADRTFEIVPAVQSLTLGAIDNQTYGAAPIPLVVGGSGPGVLSSSATGACTVDDLHVTLVAAGECTVTVDKAATSNYLAADPATRTFQVAQAEADLHWAAPDALTYGTPIGAGQLDATVIGAPQSGGSLAYTLSDDSPALGKMLSAGDHDLTVTWTPTDAGWKTLSKTVVLHVAQVLPVLSWAAPASVSSGTALGDDQLNAVADRPGSFAYTVDGTSAPAHGQVLEPGDHVLHVTFTPTDDDNVTPAIAQVSLTVLEVPPVVTPPVVTPPVVTPPVVAPVVVSTAAPASRKLKVSPKGRTTASVSCSAGTTRCTGTVQLVAQRTQQVAGKTVRRGTVLASATFSLSPGTVGKVALRPNRTGKRVLSSASLRRAQLRVGTVVRTVHLRYRS